nr:Uma2 family endonuclease [Streptomyces mesophilus]
MTAEPLSESVTKADPARTTGRMWPVPPDGGWTVDHLFSLPDLPPHTQLLDGSLVFVSPQRAFHGLVITLLENGLRRFVPAEFKVRREMTIVIDKRNGPEPDISVVSAAAEADTDQTFYKAVDVLLAVEVVSPESAARDRDTKPHKYANAGIPHFWRVESEDGRPVVEAFELAEGTTAYARTGVHRDRLKLSTPFDIDIDLSSIDEL